MSVYDFTVRDIRGNEVSLADYRGKVLLIVNTATHCGFTPQYTALQELYERHKDKGFVVLDFPSNQFGKQAPGSSEEIHQFCIARFALTFPQFEKVDVNGNDASPLFVYLKESLPGIMGDAIKWNFTKFLIGKDGKVLNRYAPTTKPDALEQDIEQALQG